MAFYYRVPEDGMQNLPTLEGIKVHEEKKPVNEPCISFDFSRHVLIELLDDITPEVTLWEELDLVQNKNILHKRLIPDSHRINCRRAIVVCINSSEAKKLARRLSQVRIIKRCICAVVIQELLSDLCLFEKQIRQHGDKRSQQQLVYVTDLNRGREPSGLVQYLKEKFSPFGTILSILVSEDKDGYAFPEGVIKFAYLSEAFAAELAYDQFVVGMERLSVTTHHNILLSQCDLRARLRAAQLRNSTGTYAYLPARESHPSDMRYNRDSSATNKTRLEHSCRNSQNHVRGSRANQADFVNVALNLDDAELLSDSAEITDVLKNPCQGNLVECLKSITMCTDSTVSKTHTNTMSVSTMENEGRDVRRKRMTLRPSLKKSSDSSQTRSPLKEQNWPSRVIGWIANLPESELPSIEVSNGTQELCNIRDVTCRISHPSRVDNNINDLEKTVYDSPLKIDSIDSFITCDNDRSNSSLLSTVSFSSAGTVISSSKGCNNIDEIVTPSSPEEYHSFDHEDDSQERIEFQNSVPKLISSTPHHRSDGDSLHICASQKRKNCSALSQKLSLKTQRTDSSQLSQTTVHFLSTDTPKDCSVVLNSIPELDNLVKNLAELQSSSISEKSTCDGNQRNLGDCIKSKNQKLSTCVKEKSVCKGFSLPNISDLSGLENHTSMKSHIVRRSSRLASRRSKDKTCNESTSSSNNKMPQELSTQTGNDFSQKSIANIIKNASPLRTWLKTELIFSTYNPVMDREESTRSVVCATINKDVLMSIGCSHMTCDFCYPSSTNLLLGFY